MKKVVLLSVLLFGLGVQATSTSGGSDVGSEMTQKKARSESSC